MAYYKETYPYNDLLKQYNDLVKQYTYTVLRNYNLDTYSKILFDSSNMLSYDDYNNNPKITQLIEFAYNTLKKYFKIKNECVHFEFWTYNPNNTTIISPLSIHTDNDNGDNIHTFIIYTQKDNTIVDGNLTIYEGEPEIITVNTGDIVCLNGNTKHRPNDIGGTGFRNCIVLMFNAIP
jgi:hypothetical protein